MVTQEAIKENAAHVDELHTLVVQMQQLHETMQYTFYVGTEKKGLPQADIDGIIENYRRIKTECQSKFKELL